MASPPRFHPERGTWRVQYWIDGKWRREVVGHAPAKWRPGDPEPKAPPEVHARYARLAKLEEESRKNWGWGIPDSLAAFLRDHVKRYDKPNTRELAQYAIEPFLAWCTDRKIMRRSQVDADVCTQYLDHIGQTLAIGTVKTRRAYLAAAWGRLLKQGKIDRNPWMGVEPVGQRRTKPKHAWTPDQFERLLEVSAPWLQDVLIFGVNTGLRIGAMMKIEWDDWIKPQSDAEGYGHLKIRAEINKTAEYTVPVSRRLNDLLIRRFGKHDPRFILTGKEGAPLKVRQHTQVSITLACKRAGLPKPQSPNHHLRRSFGRWAILGQLTGKPVPLYVVSRWMGHRDPSMTLHYLDLPPEDSVNWMVPEDIKPGPPTPPAASGPS